MSVRKEVDHGLKIWNTSLERFVRIVPLDDSLVTPEKKEGQTE